MTAYSYHFDHIFKLDDAQIDRLNKWREIQDSKQLKKEKQELGEPIDKITEMLWNRNMARYCAIAFYFSSGALCTHTKVLYKSSGDIVDLTKDDCNEFLYDYNDDFSQKYLMGKEVTEKEVLGVDR